MMQQELFLDDARDALKHAVQAIGGHAAVGAALWPSKTLRNAENWLRDCLNPERPAKLDIEEIVQILKMARKEGMHFAMAKICEEAGYSTPSIAPRKTRKQQLADEFERMVSRVRVLADELAAVEDLS